MAADYHKYDPKYRTDRGIGYADCFDAEDPYVLLKKVKASQNTGIYFLDIDLSSSMNGMKLAQQIRLSAPRGFIISITAYSELSYMTFQYRVEAMDFVLKDNPAETKVKIRECEHKCSVPICVMFLPKFKRHRGLR